MHESSAIRGEGSVVGFLEVTGRITSVWVLYDRVLTFFLLCNSWWFACLFPFLALVAISNIKWLQKEVLVSPSWPAYGHLIRVGEL